MSVEEAMGSGLLIVVFYSPFADFRDRLCSGVLRLDSGNHSTGTLTPISFS